MSKLWTPPKVQREHADNTAQFAAAVRNATHEDNVCRRWNRELERLDPLLRLVRSDHAVIGTPLVAGAYHLLRANPGAPMTVQPIVDSDGRPLPEPPGRLLEQMQQADLQNDSVVRWRERIKQAEQDREERRKALVREQRQDTILEKWKAVSETSVSMNDSTAWAQNHQGTKRNGRSTKSGAQ